MQRRRLGTLGLTVPRLILGCGNFGGIGSAPAFYGMGETDAQAAALLDAAFDAGIDAFDTADAYGGGRSEAAIGRWLASRGPSVRESVVVCTKVFNPVGSSPNERGLSRAHIVRQAEASLRRLRTDRIDLYLTHDVDPGTPWDETLGAFDDLIRAGKVLHLGASNIEAWQVAEANGRAAARRLTPLSCIQNGYSLLDRSVEREVLPYCRANGIGFTAFSPLAGGWLTGKYRTATTFPDGSRMTLRPEPYAAFTTDAMFHAIEGWLVEAARREVAPSTLATAWLLHQPGLDAVIVGGRTPTHIQDAVAALEIRLTDDESRALARHFELLTSNF